MSLVARLLSVVRRISIVIAIAIAFIFGVGSTVYLSLRSPEVTVPNVVGKDRFEAEQILADADLNFRVRATRPSTQTKADTVLFQLPRAGEVVKAGQTVAMDVSRPAKQGETPETVKPAEETSENRNANSSANENRAPRNRNRNSNANANTNSSANTNATRTVNANRPNTNSATQNSNSGTPRANTNANSNSGDGKVGRPSTNESRPRPTPRATNDNRQNL